MSLRDDFERSYISPLNQQQREAVYATEGAFLLLAVPGSGKTTVLVTRLGYMVYCRGVAPESVLTMTYTVAATGDMKRRFASLFGPEYADRLEFRTINGVSSKIIQYYSEYYRRQAFELLDNDGELTGIVRDICQSVNGEYAEIGLVKDIRTAIAFVKNMMRTDGTGKSTVRTSESEISRKFIVGIRRNWSAGGGWTMTTKFVTRK